MRQPWLALRSRALSSVLKGLFCKPPNNLRLERIGSDYGGWTIPVDLICPDWICYCGGAGEDITFDLGLSERFGCHIYSFDPTPRAVSYVQRVAGDQPRYHFYPLGLWSGDTTLRFYAPRDSHHVSHSAVNLQKTSTYFEAPARRISTLMRELNHDRIDLLKLDIEGAEYGVLESLIEDDIVVKVLLVEFDQPLPARITVRMLRRLIQLGYHPAHVHGWNYTFLHHSALP